MGLKDSNLLLDNCLQLCICHSILTFIFSTFPCFTCGVLNYAMLLGKMEIMSFLDQPERTHLKEKQQLMTITSEIIKLLCTGSARRPQFINVHKSNGYDDNSITTTVNCLKKDLPNL